MTDEELFKVYIKREVCAHCRFPQFCKGKGEKDCSDIAIIKRHYLAGVEAGKSQAETDLATVAYMQGAESGYNKAFVEADKNLKAIVADFNKDKGDKRKMTETERNQIKGALLKCAEENENKSTLTGHIVVSSLCKSAVERIEELEKEKCELLGIIQGKDKVIQELEKELNNMLVSKNQQLTKAKEIIKEMLGILPKENIEGIYEITEEAEQFLRENE